MTDRIVRQMLQWNIIEPEEKEIYRFGLEGLLLKCLHYSSYLLIAVLLQELFSFGVFFAAFMLLRKNAGGYHAKTRTGCYISSCSTVVLVIFLLKMSNALIIDGQGMVIVLLLTLFMSAIIGALAPLGNRNRELDLEEVIYFRKRTRIVLIGEIVSAFLLLLAEQKVYAAAVILAISCQAVLLGIEKIRM